MVMRFEGHITAWKDGRDVDAEYARNVKKQGVLDRIKEHKRGQRSYHANSNLATDDYWWHTRIQYLERQGENILKFPKTFEGIHGRIAGAAPVLVRPFSPSLASEADGNSALPVGGRTVKVADNALESWGPAARLFNSSVSRDASNAAMASHMVLADRSLQITGDFGASQGEFVDDYDKFEALTKVAAAAASAAITHGNIKGGLVVSRLSVHDPLNHAGDAASIRLMSRGGSSQSRSRSRGRGGRTASASTRVNPYLAYMAGLGGADLTSNSKLPSRGDVVPLRRQAQKESIIPQLRRKKAESIDCGGVLKSHINAYVLTQMRKNGGQVRRSAATIDESRAWRADDEAEPIWKKFTRAPPLRHDETKEEEEVKGPSGPTAQQLALFDYRRSVRLLEEEVEMQQVREQERLEQVFLQAQARLMTGSRAGTASSVSASASSSSSSSSSSYSSFASSLSASSSSCKSSSSFSSSS
jgi:hypothetical protein